MVSKEHSEINEYLENGDFSIQIGTQNRFGKIPMDQAIEETINKDTQTAGDTKGFRTRSGAVVRYYLTADYRSACMHQLREMVDETKGPFSHPDIGSTTIHQDEADVTSILNMFDSWRNPFTDDMQYLCSL
jgi:hypothetical protein